MPDRTDKLIARLRANGLIPRDEPAGIRVITRKPGVWQWRAFGKDGRDLKVGSRHPIREITAARWVITAEDEGMHVGVSPDGR